MLAGRIQRPSRSAADSSQSGSLGPGSTPQYLQWGECMNDASPPSAALRSSTLGARKHRFPPAASGGVVMSSSPAQSGEPGRWPLGRPTESTHSRPSSGFTCFPMLSPSAVPLRDYGDGAEVRAGPSQPCLLERSVGALPDAGSLVSGQGQAIRGREKRVGRLRQQGAASLDRVASWLVPRARV